VELERDTPKMSKRALPNNGSVDNRYDVAELAGAHSGDPDEDRRRWGEFQGWAYLSGSA
jgi:hypothetical protein